MSPKTLNWKASSALLAVSIAAAALPMPLMPLAALAFLYVIPGYAVVKIIKADLGKLETIALSLLLSLMASTFLVYWLSLLLGYSTTTFCLFFAIASLAMLFVPTPQEIKPPKISAGQIQAAAHQIINDESFPPLLLALSTALVFAFILFVSLWAPSPDGIITGGWNYGDYFLHASVIQSVNHGNFPPTEPIYAGEPLAYHWFIDLHTAIVSKLFEAFPRIPSIIDSTLGVALLSLLVYLLTLKFTGDRKAALIAAFLVIFAGGFGWLRLFDVLNTPDHAPIEDLLRMDAFDNKGDFFTLPSMLPGFLLPQRPMTAGLPALAAVLLLVSSGYPNNPRRLLLAGIILGLMPPFQYYAFLSAALLSALYFAFHHITARSLKSLQNSALVIAPSVALAFPFLLSAFGRAGSMTKAGFFWLALENGSFNPVYFIKFYAANLGPAFLLALAGIAVLFLIKKKKSEAAFLALAVFTLFSLPNLLTFSNTQWDMGKFFMCMMVPACALAGSALSWINKYASILLILACCISPLLASIFFVTSGWTGLSNAELAAGEWILANTTELSVFASSTAHNTPIDSYAGRLRILGYQSWVMNYGLDFDSRRADLQALYCGPRENAPAIMRKYSATYAYISWNEAQEYGCAPSFEGVPGFTRAYTTNEILIYKFN